MRRLRRARCGQEIARALAPYATVAREEIRKLGEIVREIGQLMNDEIRLEVLDRGDK